MINLLPEENKRDIRAARTNVILLRYNFLTLAGLALLIAICAAFYLMLNISRSAAEAKKNEGLAVVAQYADTKKAADDYKNNLTTARTVLDKSVNYTSVIMSITKLLPTGVILESLSLGSSDFGKQITFDARTKSYEQAMKLKENFQGSQLVSNVYFQSIIDENASTSGNTDYPYTVSLNATLNKVTTP